MSACPETALRAVATATPMHEVRRDAQLPWLEALFAGRVERRRLAAVLRASGVERRFTVLHEHAPHFRGVPFGAKDPGTEARFAIFAREAPPLAMAAGQRAIARAGGQADRVDHVVCASSTGPIDAAFRRRVAHALGLRTGPTAPRWQIVADEGCEGFFVGLAQARARIREAGGIALLLCVETPSLHFRLEPSLDNLSALALHGDGCGALVLAPTGADDRARLGDRLAEADRPDAPGASWSFGRDGLEFRSPCGDAASPFRLLRARLERLGSLADVDHWLFQPGDPVTLRRTHEALGIDRGHTRITWDVLRSHGNLISAGPAYVLERTLPALAAGERALLASVRPGRSTHAVALRGR